MKIYPALDLIQSECVRLKQGCFEQKTTYSSNPLEIVTGFEQAGFKYLHLIDLEGAKNGYLTQLALIETILATSKLKIQVGGGIRSCEIIDTLIAAGADRIIIGSMAVTYPNKVIHWIERYGVDKIVLALDIIHDEQNLPKVMIYGWQQRTEKSLWQLLECYQQFAALNILCTDISRDGLLQGSNVLLYHECYRCFPNLQFLVSGGVNSIEEINSFADVPNIYGVILGTALYEQRLDLLQLLKC